MLKQIQLTDFQGGIMVLEKVTPSQSIGITVAKNVQSLIDKEEYSYFELDIEDLPELIKELQRLKDDVDINIKGAKRIAEQLDDTF